LIGVNVHDFQRSQDCNRRAEVGSRSPSVALSARAFLLPV
jgi:hypothetical protein